MKIVKVTFTIVALALMSSCNSTSKSPLEELASNDLVVGTTTGAAIGAVIGRIVDGKDGAKRGALIGAGVGFIAGNIAKQRREQYASDAEFLDAEIASANKAISSKEQRLVSLEKETSDSSAKIDSLKRQIEQDKQVGPELQSLYTSIGNQLEENEATSKKYQQSLEYLESVLSSTNVEAAATAAEKDALIAKVNSLTSKRTDLTAQLARLNGVNDQIIQQQQTLIALSNQSGVKLKGKS